MREPRQPAHVADAAGAERDGRPDCCAAALDRDGELGKSVVDVAHLILCRVVEFGCLLIAERVACMRPVKDSVARGDAVELHRMPLADGTQLENCVLEQMLPVALAGPRVARPTA